MSAFQTLLPKEQAAFELATSSARVSKTATSELLSQGQGQALIASDKKGRQLKPQKDSKQKHKKKCKKQNGNQVQTEKKSRIQNHRKRNSKNDGRSKTIDSKKQYQKRRNKKDIRRERQKKE